MALQRKIICIPTLNAGPSFQGLLKSLQAYEPETPVLIIDSGSSDGTETLARQAQALVDTIPPGEFNHGNTRNLAHTLVEAEIYIFLTQDVLLANHDTLKNLVRPLEQLQEVGISYGRQLPRPGAGQLPSIRYTYFPEVAPEHARVLRVS